SLPVPGAAGDTFAFALDAWCRFMTKSAGAVGSSLVPRGGGSSAALPSRSGAIGAWMALSLAGLRATDGVTGAAVESAATPGDGSGSGLADAMSNSVTSAAETGGSDGAGGRPTRTPECTAIEPNRTIPAMGLRAIIGLEPGSI